MDAADVALFVEVIDTGSLSAVARQRGVAVSSVSRRLDALEAATRLRLLVRGRDGVVPTADGAALAVHARRYVAEGDRIARAVAGLRAGAPEPVVVSATEAMVADLLAPAVAGLLDAHPAVRIVLHAEAQLVSLAARRADLAVRMSRPEGASLIARRLAPVMFGLFTAPSYLDGRDPARVDLSVERLLGYDDSYGPLPEHGWLAGHGGAVAVRSGSTRALVRMTAAGAGIALLPRRFAEDAGLVELPSPVPLPPRHPWLVVHPDLRHRPDVRIVRRWIIATLDRALRPAGG